MIATQLTDAVNASVLTYRPLFHELRQGRAGDALQTSLNDNINLWHSHAVNHQDAHTALNSAADYFDGLQHDLEHIVDHYNPLYEAANSKAEVYELGGDTRNAQKYANQARAYLDNATSEAKAAAQHAADRISSALDGKFGKTPSGFPPEPPLGSPPPPPKSVLASSQLKPSQNPLAGLAM